MLNKTKRKSPNSRLFDKLNESEQQIAIACMKVMASCQLLSEGEIEAAMSVTLGDLQRVISQFPNIDETAPNTWHAIGMSLLYIGGANLPPGIWEQLGLTFPQAKAEETGDKWFLLLDAYRCV